MKLLQLSIETTKSFVTPGTNITLKIESRSNSFIGILAVSQTSALQSCKFDIIPKHVDKDLLRYQISSKTEESNFFTFTNLNDINTTPCNADELELVRGKRRTLKNDLQMTSLKYQKPVDNELLDCIGEILNPIKPWIFDTFISDSNSEEVTKKISDKMAAWYISGFSINHEYGLALGSFF